MSNSILILGSGGHAVSCIEAIESAGLFVIKGFVVEDNEAKEPAGLICDFPILGTDKDLPDLISRQVSAHVAFGQIGVSEKRRERFEQLVALGARLPVIRASSSIVSSRADVGDGTSVLHGSIVNAGARIGENVILNTRSLIEHGAQIGSHCHVSTGSIVNGDAIIGEGSFLGSGCVVHQNIRIGSRCVIPSGCVVSADLPDNSWWRG